MKRLGNMGFCCFETVPQSFENVVQGKQVAARRRLCGCEKRLAGTGQDSNLELSKVTSVSAKYNIYHLNC